LEAKQKVLASPVRAGRTTIVGKKRVVILGQKKAVAVWPERVRAAAMVEPAGVACARTSFSPQIGNGELT
jgi:hypothetical protein